MARGTLRRDEVILLVTRLINQSQNGSSLLFVYTCILSSMIANNSQL